MKQLATSGKKCGTRPPVKDKPRHHLRSELSQAFFAFGVIHIKNEIAPTETFA